MTHDANQFVLDRLTQRRGESRTKNSFGYGIATAAGYVRSVVDCVGHDVCKRFQIGDVGAAIKSAENRLVYANEDMLVERKETAADFRKLLPKEHKDIALPQHTAMVFRHTLTTPRIDRDGDRLRTDGAIIDPKMVGLWQHIQQLPIGKMLVVFSQDKNALKLVSVISDINDLTSDALKMLEADLLRFSHGFRVLEAEELDAGDENPYGGFDIKRFEIMEWSLVSVPSNVDAQIEMYSRGKFTSDLVKSHTKYLFDNRQKVFAGYGDGKIVVKETVGEYSNEYEFHGEQAHAVSDRVHRRLFGMTDDGFEDWNDMQKHSEAQAKAACECGTKGGVALYGYCPECGARGVKRRGDKDQCAAGHVYPSKEATRSPTAGAGKDAGEGQADAGKDAGGLVLKVARYDTKGFDVDKEHLEASTLEYEWASRFVGCAVKDLYVVGSSVPQLYAGSFLRAWQVTAADWQLHDTRNLSGAKEMPPLFEQVELNSKERDSFMVEGLRFYKTDAGDNIVVKIFPTWHGYECVVYGPKDQEAANKFIGDCWKWVDENNFLKGEAFAITGGFIQRGETDWDKVFLPEKTEKVLKRTVKVVNEKGVSAANRGIILAGPPGTGKTLSARVIMNQAKATFIWISAKDCYRWGAPSCIMQAFRLAKQLGPSIIMMEDIDHYIGDYAVDILKTEMDGVTESKGVTTILTTNFPDRLPSALIDRPGRFHDVLELHLPSKDVRVRMLKAWVPDADQPTVAKIAEKTEGYSGAHLYELAQFAKTILDEEDGLGIGGALEKALEKVESQRELIDQGQLAGQSYRPRRDSLMAAIKSAGYRAAVKSIDDSQWDAALAQATELLWPMQKERPIKEAINEISRARAEVYGVLEKAGRAFSKKNETVIRDAIADIDTCLKMDGVPRQAITILKGCRDELTKMIEESAADKDDDDTDEAAEEKVFAFADAKRMILSADAKQRKSIMAALAVLDDVERMHREGDEIRSLISLN